MKKALILIWILALCALISNGAAQLTRYPVGQLVASSVYTEPFDPCDPAYKFLQPPPKDWAEKFGANERTMLIHAISELRVVVAAQGKRLMALEEWQKSHVNAVKMDNEMREAQVREYYGWKDPNLAPQLVPQGGEAKR